ncbi:MAG: methylated-DNA--[protein]-cysteine S-methyltransferase [Gemmatimonadota bacterium]|nr:MAG: methylated-DNA--[protein]-cysteine S-methyltransferase [Gemmatimonadota bacterium]
MYRALCDRDAAYDGVFFAAIRTTGVFCRPTCTARKPREENVEYYPSARDALLAGYRPCMRCRPLEPNGALPVWLRPLLGEIERDPARRWKDADLRAMRLDPGRVRRWFQANHGMTFHAYQRARRLGLALGRIQHGDDLTRTAYDHGFESLSGFRDAFARTFDRPPGKSRAVDRIQVTRLLTPLGPMVAGANDEGVCLLEFADRRMLETQLDRLTKHFGSEAVPGEHEHIAQLDDELRRYFAGELSEFTVRVVYPGTEFQVACWEYLRTIPYGETRSYAEEARAIGNRKAQRAVGRANGDNRLAIVIPCHRVVGNDGQLTGYGGGLWRKRFLLDLEEQNRKG